MKPYKSETIKPLPCPFCGSTDIAVEESDTFRWRAAKCNCCGAQAGDVRIQTSGSGTKDEWEARAVDAAITEWNKRHNVEVSRPRE